MGKGNMDKNGPYNTKSFRNNRPVAPFFSGNSAIFMPTTTVSHSPILQAHHNTTQSDVTPFVVAIPPQAGLLPNIREYAPNIHKFTPHSRVVIPAVLSIQPSTVSDGLEADKFEDDLVEIEGIWILLPKGVGSMIRFGTYPSLVSLIQRRHSVTINLLCSFLNTCLSMLKNSWSMAPLSARSNLVISSFASSEDLLAQSQSPIVS